MREDLFGYVLDSLDTDERAAFERAVMTDDRLQRELVVIQARLSALEAARGGYNPPDGLADRTCEYVERYELDHACTPASRAAALSGEPDASRWSLADLVVASGIVVAAVSLLLPAIASSRHTARVTICADHLRQLGVALQTYSDREGEQFFPYVPTTGHTAYAGHYATVLREKELISDKTPFVCPDSHLAEIISTWDVPTEEELASADEQRLAELQRYGGGSYGYSLGCVVAGRHMPPRNQGRANYAVMADAPLWFLSPQYAANHEGRGFNLLFEDGHVQYFPSGLISQFRDDPFLSRRGLIEPGVDWDDAVIAESSTAPVVQPVSLGY